MKKDSTASDQVLPDNRIKGKSGYLYVDDGGTGGIPLLFVHSFGGSTTHWKNQLDHLRKDRRAVAFDFHNHGQSDFDSTVNTNTIADFETDILAVADSLNLDRFILVGHSMGGAASIKFAGDHSERVAGLLLVGTPGKSSPEQSKPIVASLYTDRYQQVMDGYMKQLLAGAKPDVNAMVTHDFSKVPKPVTIEIIKAVFAFDPIPSLKKYNGPKMIVSTPHENTPNALYKSFPDVPHKVVEGTSHWIQLDKPDEFNSILDEFIKEIK